MSMLAERRRKQKWRYCNPRGTWTPDPNKFGHKMLEKMGWSEGKGLGRKENGITESVRLAYKNDNQGIGYNETIETSVQQDNFKELLKELNGSDEGEKPELKSLEEKSQKSRARVHYKKFTRGKDLSSRSAKDLANIFGKKNLDDIVAEEIKEDKFQSNSNIIDRGSMADYFKNKLPNFYKSTKLTNETQSNDSDDGLGHTIGFGFNQTDFKKKKTDQSMTTFISYLDSEADCADINTKKNKKKALDESTEKSAEGLVNPAFEPLSNKILLKRHVLDTITESELENSIAEQSPETNKLKTTEEDLNHVMETPKTNKKYKKKKRPIGLSNPNFEDFHKINNEEDNSNTKLDNHFTKTTLEIPENCNNGSKNIKKRKGEHLNNSETETPSKISKKNKQSIINNGLTNEGFNVKDVHFKNSKISKKNKHKSNEDLNIMEVAPTPFNNHKINRGLLNEGFNLKDIEDTPSNVTKKSKSTHKELTKESLNLTEPELCSLELSKTNKNRTIKGLINKGFKINDTEIPKSKTGKKNKHKSTKEGSSNESFDSNVTLSKKNKDKISNGGLVNAAFDLNYIEETPSTINKKKKQKTIHEGLINNGFKDIDQFDTKLSKKSKQKANNVKGLFNQGFNINESLQDTSITSISKKKSKLECDQNQESHISPEDRTPKTKKRKKFLALDNPSFNTQDNSSSDIIKNEYEIKRKNKNVIEESTEEAQKEPQGIDNAGFNIPDCDIMLNVVEKPVKTPPTAKSERRSFKSSKKVRFNKTTQENTEYSNAITERNELFDINTKIIQEGLRNENKKHGRVNRAFNAAAQNVEESVSSFIKNIEHCQAEVENNMNETKAKTFTIKEQMIGEIDSSDGENEVHEEGIKLRYKYASFNVKQPHWMKQFNQTAHYAKKSYKHLIKGDIIVGFKNSNLHQVNGYATDLS